MNNEIELLRQEINTLRKRIETLESQARERDLEERAAFLGIIAKHEKRHNLPTREEKRHKNGDGRSIYAKPRLPAKAEV